MVTKKLLAELVGTFSLTLVVLLSVTATNFPIPTSLLAGLTLGLFVYTIGNISGCHINPAVTLGLLSIKKIELPEAVKYIIAQVVGAFLAFGLMKTLGNDVTGLNLLSFKNLFLGEIIGTSLFTFGIASVVLGKIPNGVIGLIIGASLFLGASIAGLIGAPGFLNPAVALGANSISVATLFGPIIGSVIGMQLYKFLIIDKSSRKK